MRRATMLTAALCVVVGVAGCKDKPVQTQQANPTINITVETPTSPGNPTPPTSGSVVVVPAEVTITLNLDDKGVCVARNSVPLKAFRDGSGVSADWSHDGAFEAAVNPRTGFETTFSVTASLAFIVVGEYDYKVYATVGTVSGFAKVKVKPGNCNGSGTPPPTTTNTFAITSKAVCVPGATGQNISFGWTPYPGATRYRIRRKAWTGGAWGGDVEVTSLTFMEMGLRGDTTYYYEVAAWNGSSWIPWTTNPEDASCARLPACSDLINNDPQQDNLTDAADPGCSFPGPGYNPKDDDETDPPAVTTPGPTGPGPTGPGPGGPTCAAPTFSSTWNGSSGSISVNPSSCGGRFTSDAPNFVSVSAGGSLTGLNSGCANIAWNGIPVGKFCK